MPDLLPPDPDLAIIHTRNYEVRAFKVDDTRILMRGAVHDLKPAGLYVEDDPDPLTIHHMVVDMTVDITNMRIDDVDVVFESHPHSSCPSIVPHYRALVGLSIARGFTNKVRELFGGPRGCTHTTALLHAMAPVAVQCTWSMRVLRARELGVSPRDPGLMTGDQREAMVRANLGTCHVWDPEGEHVSELRAGRAPEIPIAVSVRLRELGREPDEWVNGRD
jgi:hypothetical protein